MEQLEDLDVLIARKAQARKDARKARQALDAAQTVYRTANDRYEEAARSLRQAVEDRVDSIAPPEDGDRLM